MARFLSWAKLCGSDHVVCLFTRNKLAHVFQILWLRIVTKYCHRIAKMATMTVFCTVNELLFFCGLVRSVRRLRRVLNYRICPQKSIKINKKNQRKSSTWWRSQLYCILAPVYLLTRVSIYIPCKNEDNSRLMFFLRPRLN